MGTRLSRLEGKKRYQRAKELVAGGSSITAASNKVGISDCTFHYHRKKEATDLVKVNLHDDISKPPPTARVPNRKQRGAVEIMEAITEVFKRIERY